MSFDEQMKRWIESSWRMGAWKGIGPSRIDHYIE
jgi:hypothetical protein